MLSSNSGSRGLTTSTFFLILHLSSVRLSVSVSFDCFEFLIKLSLLLHISQKKVVHRPTELLFRVIRWTAEDAAMLLQPLMLAEDDNQDSKGTSAVDREELAGTRWAFEKDVVLIEKPTMTTREGGGGKQQKNKKKYGPASPTSTAVSTERGDDSRSPAVVAEEQKPRQLDARFAIRRDPRRPKRGRGVFAVEDVPAGTEVMRVRAVAATVISKHRQQTCACCFTGQRQRSSGEIGPMVVCQFCKAHFCEECCRRPGFKESASALVHTDTCYLARSVAAKPIGAKVDVELLFLVVDFLARRKRRLVDDEEWEAVNGLEGSEVGAAGGAKALTERELREVRERMQASSPELGISESDVQTMYSRRATSALGFRLRVRLRVSSAAV